MYGLIDIANTERFENAPPVIILTVPTIVFDELLLTKDNNSASTPGAVTNAPNLNIANNNSVYRSFFLH